VSGREFRLNHTEVIVARLVLQVLVRRRQLGKPHGGRSPLYRMGFAFSVYVSLRFQGCAQSVVAFIVALHKRLKQLGFRILISKRIFA